MSQPPPGSAEQAYKGFRNFSDSRSQYDNQAFVVWSILAKCRTNAPVQVVACTNSGGLEPVGFVDVTLLVNQIDSYGNAIPHGTIYRLPYLRVQGGANAVIIDPEPGDIGMAAFCDRDISSVKASKKRANPGSMRMMDAADGVYLFGMLNRVPTQYVQFNAAGIHIHSPVQVDLSAPNVVIDCATLAISATTSATITTPTFAVNGNTVLAGTVDQTGGGAAHFSGSIIATGDVTGQGTSLHSHTHKGVTPGGGNTGTPN